LDSNFKAWFIGFTEGDGCFFVCKDGCVRFRVFQSTRDLKILVYIQQELGFGTITHSLVMSRLSNQPTGNDRYNATSVLNVSNKEILLQIIQIFNGQLYTQKRNAQFKRWLEAYNLKYKTNVPFLSNLSNCPTLSNAWFSGFADAEGCFTVSCVKRKNVENYTQVHVRFCIAQEKL
jgi:hypothetical protein